MRSYYLGKHAVQYDQTWQRFLRKTLGAAEAAIDWKSLRRDADRHPSPMRFLDVGCGTGLLMERLARLFPSAELYGIDASPDMLAQARQRLHGNPDVHFQCLRLTGSMDDRLPYPPAFFDLITCTNVLHYLPHPLGVLKSFREALIERGQLVLEDYVLRRFPFPWNWFEGAIRLYDPEHQALFSLQEAQQMCQQASLRVAMAQTLSIDLFCRGWVARAIRQ
jgi:ubiquinone/menaquinone biosynthesis C-methylase UbiE